MYICMCVLIGVIANEAAYAELCLHVPLTWEVILKHAARAVAEPLDLKRKERANNSQCVDLNEHYEPHVNYMTSAALNTRIPLPSELARGESAL